MKGEIEALNDARDLIGRVVYAPDEELDAIALTIAATHVADVVNTFPRVLITGDRGCGKTTVLDMATYMANHPEDVTDATSYGLRAVFTDTRETGCTIIRDEVQIIFGPVGLRGSGNQLRSILCRGYRKNATLRFASSQSSVTVPIYSPAFIAGIGDHCVPDDLYSRCVRIRMEEKPDGVHKLDSVSLAVESYGEAIRDSLHKQVRAARDEIEALFVRYPSLHKKLRGRRGQVWGVLFAVAHAAGGDWPERCRAAFERLACDGGDNPMASLTPAQVLLLDMEEVFLSDEDAEYLAVRRLADSLARHPERGEFYESLGDEIFKLMTRATGVQATRKHVVTESVNTTVVVRYAADVIPLANKLRESMEPEPEGDPEEDIELG